MSLKQQKSVSMLLVQGKSGLETSIDIIV